MEERNSCELDPEKRREYRAQRAARRQQKRRALLRRRIRHLLPVFSAIIAVGLVLAGTRLARGQATAARTETAPQAEEPKPVQEQKKPMYSAADTADTVQLGEDFSSKYAILIDLNTNRILAEKEAKTVISPASMTKILTVLVAAEHVKNLDDRVIIAPETADYCYRNDCSAVGFTPGETVTVRDLFYGTVLPSGADAALSLAIYVAGSQDAFVALMNAKLEELGLSNTAHFTNCIGLYSPDHHCTVYDMAMILKAAVENDLCREVLSAHTYTTTATPEHPDGILISNWFLRRIEDKDTGGVGVLCAKTGYVTQSGSCAASYALDDSEGKGYVCVTGDAHSSWRCIYDHAELYQRFLSSERK